MNKNTVYILQKDLPYVKAGVIYAKKSYWGFIGDDYTYFPDKTGMKHERFAIHADWVENNPEWFKPKEQVNESKPTEQFQWDENLAREFGDLCNQEGWHHFSGKKNIDTLLEQFKQSKSKTAPKEEQVPIKVEIEGKYIISKTIGSQLLVFKTNCDFPPEKMKSIKEAIEGVLNGVQGQKVEISDHEYFNRGYSTGWKDAHKYNNKKYTEEQLLQARRDAFDAAREVVGYSDALKNSPVTVGRKYPTREDYINSLNK